MEYGSRPASGNRLHEGSGQTRLRVRKHQARGGAREEK
jgi:hypothetical protein